MMLMRYLARQNSDQWSLQVALFPGQTKRVLLHIPDVCHVLSVSLLKMKCMIHVYPRSPRQGELLELPAHHLPHPLLLRDVPHPGLQLPPQQQLQEQNIFQAAEVSTSTIYLFTAHQWSVPSGWSVLVHLHESWYLRWKQGKADTIIWSILYFLHFVNYI